MSPSGHQAASTASLQDPRQWHPGGVIDGPRRGCQRPVQQLPGA